MSQPIIHPEKFIKEGIDVITQSTKDPQLRDLGMEMLFLGIKLLYDYIISNQNGDGSKYNSIYTEYCNYYNTLKKQFDYQLNEKKLMVLMIDN